MPTARDDTQPYGELYIGVDGEAHFDCVTHGEDFDKARDAIIKFAALFQKQLANQEQCPYAKDIHRA